MARKCIICTHKKKAEIDKDIIAGDSLLIIARRYNISKGAVQRHRGNHVPALLAKAIQDELTDLARGSDLLGQTRELLLQAQTITTEAQETGDLRTALTGIGRVKDLLELLMKVTGELTNENQTQINIFTGPAFVDMRTRLLIALEPYPEARQAAAQALQEVNL